MCVLLHSGADTSADASIAATLTASRPKRTTSARTVDMMVEGVGVVKVSKFSLDADDTDLSKALDKRAARQREHQSLLYVSHSGRQVAGRDFDHQVGVSSSFRVISP